MTAHHRIRRIVFGLSLAGLAALSACGGGGSSSSSATSSKESVQSVTANTTMLPNDGNAAGTAAVTASKAVVATGVASATVTCTGGGTATFTVTGGTLASRGNGTLDAGEVFSFTFDGCSSAPGQPTVNGQFVLTVASNSGGVLTVTTASTNLVVVLPLRTVTLNGQSTYSQTVTTQGNTVSTMQHWVTPSAQVQSRRLNGHTSIFNFVDVDLFRTIDTVNGVAVGGTSSGHSTLEANLLFFTWRVTLTSLGAISCDGAGIVTSGTWRIDLPDDRITVVVTPTTVSVAVDYGANGTTVYFYFTRDALIDEAG